MSRRRVKGEGPGDGSEASSFLSPLSATDGGAARAAVFLGSFLVFLVQPLTGRMLLPIFGGGAAVWTVCLAVFQMLLLAGYFYADRLACVRERLRIHMLLVFFAAAWTAVAWFFFRPEASAAMGAHPWLMSLACVAGFIGVPYVILSAGSTVVQSALARQMSNPYRLYAWSNAGSLAGLLFYPLALEPFVSLTFQWTLFIALVLVYAALLWRLQAVSNCQSSIDNCSSAPQLLCASALKASAPQSTIDNRQFRVERTAWLLYPALLSFLLNATVAHLFTDVTPIPMIWDIMLTAFLLAWIIGFSPIGGRCRALWSLVGLGAVLFAACVNGLRGTGSFFPNAGAAVAVLAISGSVLVRALYESRPENARLARYYLYTALGGALGGALATFAAPLLFNQVFEYPLALLLVAGVSAARLVRGSAAETPRLRCRVAALAAVALVGATLFAMRHVSTARVLFRGRSFYGCVRVTRTLETLEGQLTPVTYLWCGQTTHGVEAGSEGCPYSYYMLQSAGNAFFAHPKYCDGKSVRVGVVGLGIGALAAYGRKGDLFRFYEINPMIERVALDRRYFNFLRNADCSIDLVEGDARMSLAREDRANDPKYDILVLDAYSGDAVPYHLITREAFELYARRLLPDGIMALHISNWHIDLLPVCKALAEDLGLYAYGLRTAGDGALVSGTVWVFFTRTPLDYPQADPRLALPVEWADVRSFPVPRDDRGSLLSLFHL